MPKTPEQKAEQKFQKFLAAITKESELFGLLGREYPHSFYRIFIRTDPTAKWWRIEAGSAQEAKDPFDYQHSLPVKSRTGVVWGSVQYGLVFDHIEGEPMRRLVARIEEVCGPSPEHVVRVAGPRTKTATVAATT